MAKTRLIFKILCHVIMVKLDHSFYKALIARMIVTLEARFAIATERNPQLSGWPIEGFPKEHGEARRQPISGRCVLQCTGDLSHHGHFSCDSRDSRP